MGVPPEGGPGSLVCGVGCGLSHDGRGPGSALGRSEGSMMEGGARGLNQQLRGKGAGVRFIPGEGGRIRGREGMALRGWMALRPCLRPYDRAYDRTPFPDTTTPLPYHPRQEGGPTSSAPTKSTLPSSHLSIIIPCSHKGSRLPSSGVRIISLLANHSFSYYGAMGKKKGSDTPLPDPVGLGKIVYVYVMA